MFTDALFWGHWCFEVQNAEPTPHNTAGWPGFHPVPVQSLHQCSATAGEMRQLHPHTAAEKLSLPELTGPVSTAYCRWARRLREGLDRGWLAAEPRYSEGGRLRTAFTSSPREKDPTKRPASGQTPLLAGKDNDSGILGDVSGRKSPGNLLPSKANVG